MASTRSSSLKAQLLTDSGHEGMAKAMLVQEEATWSSSPWISDEGFLGKLLTPTIAHVWFVLDLINWRSLGKKGKASSPKKKTKSLPWIDARKYSHNHSWYISIIRTAKTDYSELLRMVDSGEGEMFPQGFDVQMDIIEQLKLLYSLVQATSQVNFRWYWTGSLHVTWRSLLKVLIYKIKKFINNIV